MFLAIDESKSFPQKIIGGVLLPLTFLPDLEKEIVKVRIDHKMFAEIKWEDINKNFTNGYIKVSDFLFDNSELTFHSMCYRDEAKKYRAAYILIRTICWKMWNANIKEPLYILFDNDSQIGARETKIIGSYLGNDTRVKHKIEFCNQGTSHILGALQLVDLVVGAVAYVVNKRTVPADKTTFVENLIKRNDNIPLDFSLPGLPKLNEIKIHYFDPDSRA